MRSKSISHKFFLYFAATFLVSNSQWVQAAATCTATTSPMTITYPSPVLTAVPGTLTISCITGNGPSPITMTYSINAAPPAAAASDLQYVLKTPTCSGSLWDSGTPITGSFSMLKNSNTSVTVPFSGCAAADQYPNLSVISYTVPITGTVTSSAGPAPTFTPSSFTLTTSLPPGSTTACALTALPGPITIDYNAFSATAINKNTSFGLVCSPGLSPTMSIDATADGVTGLNYTLGLDTVPGTSGTNPFYATGMGYSVTYYINVSMAAGQAGTCTNINCSNTNNHLLIINY